MILRVFAQTSAPPIEYRMNGGQWQESPVFEDLDPLVENMAEIRDASGCTSRQFYPAEEELEILIPAVVVSPEGVFVQWATNIPATTRIEWGYQPDLSDGTIEDEDTEFKTVHRVPFPEVVIDTLHFARAWSRTCGNQQAESDIISNFVIGDFEFIWSNFFPTRTIIPIPEISQYQRHAMGIDLDGEGKPSPYDDNYEKEAVHRVNHLGSLQQDKHAESLEWEITIDIT